MSQRLSRSEHWAEQRADLGGCAERITERIRKLHDLVESRVAEAWQRQFATFQSTQRRPSFDHLDAATQSLLAEIYGGGQIACDAFTVEVDKARNLAPRAEHFVAALGELNLLAAAADIDRRLSDLQIVASQLDAQSGDLLRSLEQLSQRMQRWSAALVHCSLLHKDPRARLAACHGAGELARALQAFDEAFAGTPDVEIPLDAVERRLDCLARSGQREPYRAALVRQGTRVGFQDLVAGRLNEFGRQVRPAVAWILLGEPGHEKGSGSGFLVARDCVATNRHVVFEDGRPESVERVRVFVGGTPCRVVRIRVPPSPDIDLAVLDLAAPLDVTPLRVGYTSLVEVGERALAVGFPLPEGDSFDENLLMDEGIVNRIRSRPQQSGRELELSVKLGPGMSGGPVFNDLGEVVAVTTFIRFRRAGRPDAPIVERSSHAIAVDALHELLSPRW